MFLNVGDWQVREGSCSWTRPGTLRRQIPDPLQLEEFFLQHLWALTFPLLPTTTSTPVSQGLIGSLPEVSCFHTKYS